MTDAEKQNAEIVRAFVATMGKLDPEERYNRFFAPDSRVRWESAAASPVQWEKERVHIGPAAAAAAAKQYYKADLIYEAKIDDLYAGGSVVVTKRTDTRVGLPGTAAPVTAVFIVKNGKIPDWTDYLGVEGDAGAIDKDNTSIVRGFIEAMGKASPDERYRCFAPDSRIWWEGPEDSPTREVENKFHNGPAAAIAAAMHYYKAGLVYETQIDDMYACAPVVVARRTDTRKEAGTVVETAHTVGVFVVKNGKVVEWRDYIA